jgi:predicted RNase H-like HicB family nuclease
MLTDYLNAAMHRAKYDLMEDGTFYGQIPGFEGVWGNASSLEDCRNDLRSALEDWLVLGLWMNDENLPKLGKLDLVPRKFVTAQKNESASTSRTRKAS